MYKRQVLDCSNPMVFIRAKDLGIQGTELVELNQNQSVMEHIERIRCIAAWKCGFVEHWEDARTKSTSAPKVSIISAPHNYMDMDKHTVQAESMDICCRAISVGALHKAYPMTVACLLYTSMDRGKAGELIKVGIPISFQECMVRLSFLYLTSVTNALGVAASSAVGIAGKYDVFAMLPATSAASACLLYTSRTGVSVEVLFNLFYLLCM